MNFLVVIPKFTSSPGQDYIFPVGIAYITAALKRAGFNVRGIDLNHFTEPPQEVLAQAIKEHSIDVIATGTISAHFDKVKAVLEAARQTKPRIITIVGGGVISSEPVAMMDTLKPHFGVLGEGEQTMVELARELSSTRKYSEVSGLIYRDPDGELRTTPARAAIRDLGELPFPDDELLGGYYQRQSRVYNIVSSRSCPYKCTFCYHPIGNIYRQRTLDDLFEEIEHSYRKYSPYHYRIIDELFSIKPERVQEFCRRIKSYNVKWDVQMRVSDVDPELLATMRDAGCVLVSYGLESGSQKVLESMCKHTKVADLIRAVDVTYEARLQVQGAFIFGDPAETIDSAVETFSLWLQHRKACIGMWPIEVYPGTPLYHDAVKNGTIPDPAAYITNGCRSINLMNMPDRDALQVHLLMYLLAITYNRVPGRVLSCKPGKVVEQSSGEAVQLFNVTVQCPHCEGEISYPESPLHGGQKWVCHKCNRRFDIQPLSQWRHWPEVFNVSRNYEFQPTHAEEMKRFLRQEDWLGNKIVMPGYMEVVLFGVHYLVPANVSLDQIRYGLMKIFIADEETGRMDPVVIYDGDYVPLHNPFYLKSRVEELVAGWRKRDATVVVAGFSSETANLLEWTNLGEARLAGVLALDPKDEKMATLGVPLLNLQEIVNHPPSVLLVSAAKNQRQLTELFAGVLARLGVEVVALYSSGTHF